MKTRDIKDRLNAIDFSDCKKWEDMYAKIREVLRYEMWATDAANAEDFFADMCESEFNKSDVHHNVIWTGIANVDDVDYKAIVTEHYVDAGSVDYLYSLDIVRI